MERSPEIEAVFRRLLEALPLGDSASAGNLVSESRDVRFITTAEDEWWQGHDEVARLALVRVRESGMIRFEFLRLEGFEEKGVGWVAAEVAAHRASQEPLVLRHTATMVLEAGTWRIVQWHISAATPNIEVFGHTMPGSLGDLVSAFEDDKDTLGESFRTGTVTVMFTDVEDSTVVSERVGDAVWTDLIADHFALVRQIVERQGGSVVKTLGDGAMTAFGSASSAIEAAIEIQRAVSGSSLRVRIGAHTGDSLRREGDYFGVAVNKAARIAAVAVGGEIMVSSVTAELSRGHRIAYGAERRVSLKGLEGTHGIVPVAWGP